jgi:hypothetical protein
LYRLRGNTYETFSRHKPGKKIIIRDKTRLVVHGSHHHSSHSASQIAFQNGYE